MIRAILIIVASFLILIVSGCANTVNTPTTQQRYLVVSATMSGPVDLTQFRYFVFVKYGASGTVWPDLTTPNQNNYVLSLPNNASGGIDGINTGKNAGFVISNFQFDEFYERSSNKGVSSGTFTNVISATNNAVIVTISPSSPVIQFSIPLNTASSPIGISVVTTPNNTSPYDYVIQDYTSPYFTITNQLGYTTTVQPNPTVVPTNNLLPIASGADIISWSASII